MTASHLGPLCQSSCAVYSLGTNPSRWQPVIVSAPDTTSAASFAARSGAPDPAFRLVDRFECLAPCMSSDGSMLSASEPRGGKEDKLKLDGNLIAPEWGVNSRTKQRCAATTATASTPTRQLTNQLRLATVSQSWHLELACTPRQERP